jgi:serine/threonine-protein kinase
MFAPGDKLEYGHYTVLRELGAGGMGVVYHCRDEFLQREIAIKMLLPELMSDDDTVDIFRLEARLAAQLEHPNIVTIHNIGIENKDSKVHHYIAMEFLPGGSLKQRIESDESIPLEQSLEWMKQMTTGVNYAHKRGVVHQDIKPDNVFITHDGNLKIGDFGLALIASGVAVERAVQGKGTPAYMSPELCRGDPQDYRSDIYSLGAVFYELLTREKPYKAAGMIEMAMKHATAPVPSVKKLNPEVPDVLDKAVQKMMAKTPDERYGSLAEVLTLLEKLLLEMQVARLGMAGQLNLRSDSSAAAGPAAATKAKPDTQPVKGPAAPGAAPSKPAAKAEGKSQSPPVASKYNQDETPAHIIALSAKPPVEAPKQNAAPPAKAQAEAPAPVAKPAAAPVNKPGVAPVNKPQAAPAKSAADSKATAPEATAVPKPATPPAEPAKTQSKSAKSSTMDELDTLLDTLLAEKDEGAPKPKPAAVSKPAQPTVIDLEETQSTQAYIEDMIQKAAESPPPPAVKDNGPAPVPKNESPLPAKPEAPAAKSQTPPKAKPEGKHTFQEDVTIDIDSVLQSKIRSEAAALAAAAQTGSNPHEAEQAALSAPVPSKPSDRKSQASSSLVMPKQQKLAATWTFKTQGPIGWSSSPVLSKDRKVLYVTSSDGRLYAVDATTGSNLWHYDTGGAILSSPVVATDGLYVASSNGSLHAVNFNGEKLWQTSLDSPLVATPLEYELDLIVASMDGSLRYVNHADGSIKWTYRTEGPLVSPPQLLDKNVFVTSKDKSLHAVSADRGWRQWTFTTQAAIVSSPLVSTDSVYFGSTDGNMYSVEAESGRQIWKYQTEKAIVSRGTLEFNAVTVSSEDKHVHCIDKYKGSMLWKSKLQSPVLSELVSSGGNLYAANREGWLQCFSVKNGELTWQMNCEGRLESSPVISGKTLYVARVNGQLTAYILP